METTLHFAQNADAGTEESYLRNLPLLKLLAKENIEADDWSVLLAATPNNGVRNAPQKRFWPARCA